jgi:hypothetical protein
MIDVFTRSGEGSFDARGALDIDTSSAMEASLLLKYFCTDLTTCTGTFGNHEHPGSGKCLIPDLT